MSNYEYPYTDFNEYNLDWCIKRIRDLTVEWAETKTEWSDMKTELEALQLYITTYFDNLDVQTEINHKLDEMADNGTLALLIYPYINPAIEGIPDVIEAWLEANVDPDTGYVIDKTLSVGDAAADAEVTGDRLEYLNDAIIEDVVFDWNDLGNATYPTGFRTGYYDQGTGTAGSSSSMARSRTYKVFADDVYSITLAPPYDHWSYITEYQSDGTFLAAYVAPGTPAERMGVPVHVLIQPGFRYQFTLCAYTGLSNDNITDAMCDAHVLTMHTLKYAFKEDIKKPTVQYETGSFANGDADARLSIYLPATNGYILYRLYHFNVNADNVNAWSTYHAYHTDDSFGSQTDLTISGEWDCAVKLNGRPDFSGGNTHGDEIMSSIQAFLNGKPINYASLTSLTTFKELRIVQQSALYDPNDGVTKIADHAKEWIFTEADGMVLNQALNWTINATLDNCFLAMYPPNKTECNRGMMDCDFVIETLESTNYTITKEKVRKAFMYKTGGGLSAEVSIPVYPEGLTGGDRATFSDNNGLSYNKLYFKVCSGGTISSGDLWKSQTVYKLDYNI